MNKTVTIIQARVGSTRLPGKVLMDICGQSMLERVVRRVQRCKEADDVMIATTRNPEDEAIVREADRLNVKYYCGSEEDVLSRYYEAAQHCRADIIVRICSDSPLVDPEVSDEVIRFLKRNYSEMDFCYNHGEKTYPLGLDTQAFKFSALERAFREATCDYERTHVTPFIYLHPELFRVHNLTAPQDFSALRWSVDTEEDMVFMRTVYEKLADKKNFTWRDVLQLLEKQPAIKEINQMIIQKDLKEC